MANIRALFSNVFAYVLLFEQASHQGQGPRPYEEVRGEISALLEQAGAAARRQTVPERDYQEARFAVVAWIDETIANSSWEHRNRWNASPLQDEYFHTKSAGRELFDHLAHLGPEQRDVREVYYLCLGLGFSGQYSRGPENELRLKQIRHEQAPYLPVPVEDIQNLKTITPQPYEVGAPGGRPPQPPWTQWLRTAGLAVLLLAPIAFFVIYKFWPVAQFQLMVAKAGNGSGTVLTTPSGINCGADCEEAYARRTAVTLTAIPDPGSVFNGWAGDLGCASGVVSLTSNKTCLATFNLELATHQLVVTKAGSGSGRVISTPDGLNCGPDCSQAYATGTLVKLKADPDPDSVFAGWSGDPDCLRDQVAMTGNKTCTAMFNMRLTSAMILERLGRPFPCAKVVVKDIDVQTGHVHLEGRVASDEARREISTQVQNIKGVTKVNDSFQVIPQPFCEVVELLEPFKERNERQQFGLVGKLNRQGQPLIYIEGDKLIVEVTTPKGFDGYVYVDYYGTNGEVGHMFPDPKMFRDPWRKVFPRGSSLTVDGGPEPWRIQPPFGVELVTVIASKEPLFPGPRQEAERIESYINELRRALPTDVSTSEAAAEFYFITTKGR